MADINSTLYYRMAGIDTRSTREKFPSWKGSKLPVLPQTTGNDTRKRRTVPSGQEKRAPNFCLVIFTYQRSCHFTPPAHRRHYWGQQDSMGLREQSLDLNRLEGHLYPLHPTGAPVGLSGPPTGPHTSIKREKSRKMDLMVAEVSQSEYDKFSRARYLVIWQACLSRRLDDQAKKQIKQIPNLEHSHTLLSPILPCCITTIRWTHVPPYPYRPA